jgi:3-oxoacyl-[acyl-carrier-protein] synthase III
MGAIIKNVSTVSSNEEKGLLNLTSKAITLCLENCEHSIEEIDIIISASIYGEDYLCEPALATLILQSLNKGNNSYKQFAFDINNGGGSIINAFQIMDTLIKDGRISKGVIVAGDCQPKIGNVNGFEIKSGAAAILIHKSTERGFCDFYFETFPEYLDKAFSYLSWDKNIATLHYTQQTNLLAVYLEISINSINAFLTKNRMSIEEIDSIICSQAPLGFQEKLNKKLGFKNTHSINQGQYSGGILYSLEKNKQTWDNYTNILIVNVGPGILISITLYKHHQNELN